MNLAAKVTILPIQSKSPTWGSPTRHHSHQTGPCSTKLGSLFTKPQSLPFGSSFVIPSSHPVHPPVPVVRQLRARRSCASGRSAGSPTAPSARSIPRTRRDREEEEIRSDRTLRTEQVHRYVRNKCLTSSNKDTSSNNRKTRRGLEKRSEVQVFFGVSGREHEGSQVERVASLREFLSMLTGGGPKKGCRRPGDDL